MKAMILAAGYGTRLKPFTHSIPKALVEIEGTPLIEIVIRKLINSGVREIIVNTHHFAEQIEQFLKSKDNFGIHIERSFEPDILGTGGGLKEAAYFLKNSEPFLLHNVDILSTINLKDMHNYHVHKNAFVTLAVKNRQTKRYFLLNKDNRVYGHEDLQKERKIAKNGSSEVLQRRAFSGIHIISPKIFQYMTQDGQFSIIDVYLDLIERGLPIFGYPSDQYYWRDVGKVETLRQINNDIETKRLKLEGLY